MRARQRGHRGCRTDRAPGRTPSQREPHGEGPGDDVAVRRHLGTERPGWVVFVVAAIGEEIEAPGAVEVEREVAREVHAVADAERVPSRVEAVRGAALFRDRARHEAIAEPSGEAE